MGFIFLFPHIFTIESLEPVYNLGTNLNISVINGSEEFILLTEGDVVNVFMMIEFMEDSEEELAKFNTRKLLSDTAIKPILNPYNMIRFMAVRMPTLNTDNTGNNAINVTNTTDVFQLEARILDEDVAIVKSGSHIYLNQYVSIISFNLIALLCNTHLIIFVFILYRSEVLVAVVIEALMIGKTKLCFMSDDQRIDTGFRVSAQDNSQR